MVIKLGHDHRTLNPIVKRIVLIGAANPREIGLMKVVLNLLHARLVGALGQWLNERLHQIQEATLLVCIELSRRNPFISNDAVVMHRATQMQLIGFMTTPLRQISTDTIVVNDGFLALT